jgi:hypothetical protein
MAGPRADAEHPKPENTRVAKGAAKPRPKRSYVTAVGAALGALLGAGGLASATWASGCGNEAPPPGPSSEAPLAAAESSGSSLPEPPAPPPEDSNAPVVEEPDPPEKVAEEPEKPWEGPWIGAMAQATPIYPTPRFSRNRLGYIRRGGKVPVIDKPVAQGGCKQGFYPLAHGGYVCGNNGTLDLEDPRVKMGIKPGNLDALLPYRYAYNSEHGTPLYNAVPSREEMLKYEPYLKDKDKKAKKDDEPAAADIEKADQPRPDTELAATEPSGDGQFLRNGGLAIDDPAAQAGGAAPEPEKPWWQRDKDQPVNVTLADLEGEGDGTLSKRMVKGFFIAVDHTFGWQNRMWYKTTGGLVAPADRMIIPKTPELKGVSMEGLSQVGFVRARDAFKYKLADGDMKRGNKLPRLSGFGLTGTTKLFKKERYRETVDGWWMRERDGTWTDPRPRPSEVGASEKWIDVNLTRRTLVAFEGDKAVYAALVSPGKRSSDKKRDHRTKTGMWRIREKHLTATMDGDGIAGDLPYSIQDVPFVQYYDGSYAMHGAFWHENFGAEQSHGCVNLSPADSKHLFLWSDPQLPRGWHGVFASEKRKGSMVVIHE